MTHERESHWQGVYTTKDVTAVSWYQDQPTVSLRLFDDLEVGPKRSVIDVGAGASGLVDALLARGFGDVTVLDISAAALDVARTRLGARGAEVTWLVHDLLEWMPERTFDVWHDRAVLHFLTREEDQQAYGRLLDRAVAPEGFVVIGTFAPGGPTQCSGLDVQQHDATSVLRLAGPAFELVSERFEDHTTPSGAVQRFCWTVLRRS